MKYRYRPGYRQSKTYATAQICKADKRHGVVVPTPKHMDVLIALGVQPSQIIVMSEQRRQKPIEIIIDEAYKMFAPNK